MEILLTIHVIIVICLIAVILVQKSSDEGFVSGGGMDALMSGRAKANFMTRLTSTLAAAFIIMSIVLTYITARQSDENAGLNEELKVIEQEEVAPTAPNVPEIE